MSLQKFSFFIHYIHEPKNYTRSRFKKKKRCFDLSCATLNQKFNMTGRFAPGIASSPLGPSDSLIFFPLFGLSVDLWLHQHAGTYVRDSCLFWNGYVTKHLVVNQLVWPTVIPSGDPKQCSVLLRFSPHAILPGGSAAVLPRDLPSIRCMNHTCHYAIYVPYCLYQVGLCYLD